MKKFSDFATEQTAMTGDKVKLDDILDEEIVIKQYKVADSKYNDNKVLTLQIEIDGVERIIFTGSKVLIEQIVRYKDELPFIAKVKKVDKFYTFT